MIITRSAKYKFVEKCFIFKANKLCEPEDFANYESGRAFSMQFNHRKKDNTAEKMEHKDEGYMKRRLEQLEEAAMEFGYDKEKMMGSKILKKPKESLIDQDPQLKQIYNTLDEKKFENEYQGEISYSRIPIYVGKESENIALLKPWKGGNNAEDLNSILQNEIMLKKYNGNWKRKGTLVAPRSLRRSENIQDRLHKAREKTLDYTLAKYDQKMPNKDEEYEKQQSEKFREMYKERLLGVEQVSLSALNHSIKSLADSKIEEAMSKGAFNNLPRGRAIDNEFNHNAYVDGTEYHLNKMLKNQKVTLPWIEKQGSVHIEIQDFRRRLKNDWLTRVVHIIDDKLKSGDKSQEQKLRIVKQLAENYELLQDKNWENQKKKELKPLIRKLNDSIRGYNLQAPMSSQIFYLVEDRELERARKGASCEIYAEVKRFWFGNDTKSFSIGKVQLNQGSKSNQRERIARKSLIFSIFDIFK